MCYNIFITPNIGTPYDCSYPKILSIGENSVDTDQTAHLEAVWSGSTCTISIQSATFGCMHECIVKSNFFMVKFL